MDICQKPSRHLPENEPLKASATTGSGQPSQGLRRLRITSYLSQHRSEAAATTFIQQICGASDGQAAFFTSDKSDTTSKAGDLVNVTTSKMVELRPSLIHHFSSTRECFHDARKLFLKPIQQRPALNHRVLVELLL